MTMFPWYIIITIILTLVFLIALLILAIRTKSIGIGLIFVSLLFGKVLTWVIRLFFGFFIDNIKIGDMNPFEIFSFLQSSVYWFVLITCTIGVFLIYNEWKRGKFQPSQSENRYQLHN